MARYGNHFLIRCAWPQVAHQFSDIVRKIIGASGAFATQGAGGHLVGAGCAAQAQVDPTRVEAGQGTELLGDHQWSMVGQHDAAGAHPYGRSAAGQVAQQYGGRRTGDAIHVVVFGHPETVIAELFDVLCKIQRVA
ncbi:hypothetical protein D3C85_1137260 [compost metagenome]